MKKIIVAEDDPSIQDAITLILESEGYEVYIFASGYPVVNNEFDIPDLFILDKQLSGIDGLDVCIFLKSQESTRHIPVIMLSANPHIVKLAKLAGADNALEKPFKMRDLKKIVADCPADSPVKK